MMNIDEHVELTSKIGHIEVFQFNPQESELISTDSVESCYCLFHISSNGVSGWGDCIFSCECKHLDLVRWATVFEKMKGLTISEAVLLVQSKQLEWGDDRYRLAMMSLENLIKESRHREDLTEPLIHFSNLENQTLFEKAQSYYSIL